MLYLLLLLVTCHLTFALDTSLDSYCSPYEGFTITSQADVAQIANCSIVKTSIVISASGSIALDGPLIIEGDLYVSNGSGLTNLSSTTIMIIDSSFILDDLPLLSTVQFSQQLRVGIIAWSNLPSLFNISLYSPYISRSITVSKTSIDSLDFTGSILSSVDINNNNRLNSISSSIVGVDGPLNLIANSNNTQISFPSMRWATSIAIQNCQLLEISSLQTVYGSFLINETSTRDLSANELVSVGDDGLWDDNGNLIIQANPNLTEVNMGKLSSVRGALQASENAVLDSLYFRSLNNVVNISLIGNFSTVDLSSLSTVYGAFILESNDISRTCSAFLAESTKSTTKGASDCKNIVIYDSQFATLNPHPRSKLSDGAKVGIVNGVVFGVLFLGSVILAISFTWKKGYRIVLQRPNQSQTTIQVHSTNIESSRGDDHVTGGVTSSCESVAETLVIPTERNSRT